MARTTTVSLVDDIDGHTPATETIRFALDGVSYEIDLSDANARALRDALHRWIAAGRRVGGSGSQRSKTPARDLRGPVDPAQNEAIRAWEADGRRSRRRHGAQLDEPAGNCG